MDQLSGLLQLDGCQRYLMLGQAVEIWIAHSLFQVAIEENLNAGKQEQVPTFVVKRPYGLTEGEQAFLVPFMPLKRLYLIETQHDRNPRADHAEQFLQKEPGLLFGAGFVFRRIFEAQGFETFFFKGMSLQPCQNVHPVHPSNQMAQGLDEGAAEIGFKSQIIGDLQKLSESDGWKLNLLPDPS